MMRSQQEDHNKVLCELSALVLNLLRSPAPRRRSTAQISPAGFASLLLGISLTLMLCGSVTFFIGFILMPWVLGLVMVFYAVGLVSSLSMLGRSIVSYATAPSTPPPRKGLPEWKHL